MADMKSDRAAAFAEFTEGVNDRVAQYTRSIRECGDEAITNVRMAYDAREKLPERSTDLLASAAIATVTQIEVGRSFVPWVRMRDEHGSEFSIAQNHELPAGKYRVLLFVVPIK